MIPKPCIYMCMYVHVSVCTHTYIYIYINFHLVMKIECLSEYPFMYVTSELHLFPTLHITYIISIFNVIHQILNHSLRFLY